METVRERLIREFKAAIPAVLGNLADKPYINGIVTPGDLSNIAHKVNFYLDD